MKFLGMEGTHLGKLLFAVGASIFVTFALLQAAGGSGSLGPGGASGSGVLAGSVSIGPCCPVERIGYSCCQANIYSSRSLVLRANFGSVIYILLNSDGTFSMRVPQNAYSVTLTNCTYLGCGRVFPTEVSIAAGRTTTLNISIDTGIR